MPVTPPMTDGQSPHGSEPVRVLRLITRMNLGGPAYAVALVSGRMAPRYETLLVTGRVGPGEVSAEGLADRYGARLVRVDALGREPHLRDDLSSFVQLVRIIRRFKPHIVHTHTAKAGFVGRVAALVARPRRPLIVHTYEGHVLEGYFSPLKSLAFRTLEWATARVTDAIVGVSRATVDELVRLGIAPAAKFRVISLGLELGRFVEVERRDGEPFRAELGVEPDDVLATFVGRLVPIKRVDVGLKAIALARQEGTRIKLAVVGDGELRASLEAQSRDLGLEDVVHFVGYRSDIPEIAAATDIALLTSDNEGLGASLIEAEAAGRPVVATAVGGVPEAVCSDCGCLVPAGDPEAVAAALTLLARDPDLRDRMGARAREYVLASFSADRLVHDFEAFYDELVAAHGVDGR